MYACLPMLSTDCPFPKLLLHLPVEGLVEHGVSLQCQPMPNDKFVPRTEHTTRKRGMMTRCFKFAAWTLFGNPSPNTDLC